MNRLPSYFDAWGVDALLVENPTDLYYLTALDLSRGRLLIGKEGASLYVDGRYFAYATQEAPCPVYLWGKEKIPFRGNIGFDSAATTIAELEQLRKEAPEARWIPCPKPLKKLRAIKTPAEIEQMERAAQITWEGVSQARASLKEGASEREIAWIFESFVRTHGASGLSFEPIIAFGEHTALPHHRAKERRLRQNEAVLMDVGAIWDHYRADMTRVVFFGKPSERLQTLHCIVEEAYQQAAAAARIGERFGRLDECARAVFRQYGVEELFSHSLGHGIGLETHEFPIIRHDGADRDVLIEEGMVFTIEPGLYDPALGGIRYENTGAMTKDGFQSFYPFLLE